MWERPSSSSANPADDLIELCDDTADDNLAPADAFIADAYAKVHLLICTIASRDLIVRACPAGLRPPGDNVVSQQRARLEDGWKFT